MVCLNILYHALLTFFEVMIARHRTLVKKCGVRSLKFIWLLVYSCTGTHWLRPRKPPPPRISVSQNRRHLCVPPVSNNVMDITNAPPPHVDKQ
jgi:hypothetical protein